MKLTINIPYSTRETFSEFRKFINCIRCNMGISGKKPDSYSLKVLSKEKDKSIILNLKFSSSQENREHKFRCNAEAGLWWIHVLLIRNDETFFSISGRYISIEDNDGNIAKWGRYKDTGDLTIKIFQKKNPNKA